jgi:hypothetical protein
VLDLTARVSPHEPGSERGLLGLAFNPVDGRLFVYFTDVDVQSHVVSYAVGPDGVPDPASAWTVIDIPQPGVGHKGGGMSFDETGVLYLALGDGGGSNGRDAQDYTKLLGGIIRITPSTTGPGRQPLPHRSRPASGAVGQGPAQPVGLLARSGERRPVAG